jgi:hypothetical protein
VTAVCLSAVFFVAAPVFQALTGVGPPAFVILAFMWLVPASVGIAILRYRLYEIDVIIRKTLVYGALVAALAIVYLGGVSLLGWAFTSVSGQSGALSVTLSTLAVAAAFQPLRARIQEAVDRRFYRSKYDAARALEAFGGRLRQQVDLDALHGEVLGVVHQTVQPATASLWLRS